MSGDKRDTPWRKFTGWNARKAESPAVKFEPGRGTVITKENLSDFVFRFSCGDGVFRQITYDQKAGKCHFIFDVMDRFDESEFEWVILNIACDHVSVFLMSVTNFDWVFHGMKAAFLTPRNWGEELLYIDFVEESITDEEELSERMADLKISDFFREEYLVAAAGKRWYWWIESTDSSSPSL